MIKGFSSITGFFSKNLAIDLLKNLPNYLIYKGVNSTCYKVPFRRKFLFIKISSIPPTTTLLESEILCDICNYSGKYFLRHYDFVKIEEDFLGVSCPSVMTICDFIEDVNFLKNIVYLQRSPKLMDFFLEKTLIGIKSLHLQGILHRDINISNLGFVRFNRKISPVILDINIFKPKQSETIFYSPEFLHPEVTSWELYSEKHEIWALGILFYFILTLNFPFQTRITGKFQRIESKEQLKIRVEFLPENMKELLKLLLLDNDEEFRSIKALPANGYAS